MANFSALIAQIQAYVKQNGNNDIEGNGLQQILVAMVNSIGGASNEVAADLAAEVTTRGNADYNLQQSIAAEAQAREGAVNGEAYQRTQADNALQTAINAIKNNIDNGFVYAGIATPSGTPVSGRVFYLARQAGTYTNFGGLTLTEGVNVLKYNGSAWSSEQIIGIDDAVTDWSNNLVKSGVLYNELYALKGINNASFKGKIICYDHVAMTGGGNFGKILPNGAYDMLVVKVPVNAVKCKISSGYSGFVKYSHTLGLPSDAATDSGQVKNVENYDWICLNYTKESSVDYNSVSIEFYDNEGYVYAGIATPTGNPVSGKVFYVAAEAGTYTNFGGLTLSQGINILKYDGTEWKSEQICGIDDSPVFGSNALIKSGGVYNELYNLKGLNNALSKGKIVCNDVVAMIGGTNFGKILPNANYDMLVVKVPSKATKCKISSGYDGLLKYAHTLGLPSDAATDSGQVKNVENYDWICINYTKESSVDYNSVSIEFYDNQGALYAGIATPSTTPVSGNVFYIATEAGTYTNFGNLVLTAGINILKNDGTAWSSEQVIGIDDTLTKDSNNLAKSGSVYAELYYLKGINNAYFKGKSVCYGYISTIGGTNFGKILPSDNYDMMVLKVPVGMTKLKISSSPSPIGAIKYTHTLGDPSEASTAISGDVKDVSNCDWICLDFNKSDSVNYNAIEIEFYDDSNYIYGLSPKEFDELILNNSIYNSEKNVIEKYVALFGGTYVGAISPNDNYDMMVLKVPQDVSSIKVSEGCLAIVTYEDIQDRTTATTYTSELSLKSHIPLSRNIRWVVVDYERSAQVDYSSVEINWGGSMLPSIKDKTIWTLGDSFSANNIWQQNLGVKTRCVFYPALNTDANNPLSVGGTRVDADDDKGAQQRARNLVSLKNNYSIDIVFLQAYNDRSIITKGNITDKAFMRSGRYTVPPITGHESLASLQAYLETNLIDAVSLVPSEERKVGLVVTFLAETGSSSYNGSKVTLSGTPQNGTLGIVYGGMTYNVQVSSGMTIPEVIQKVIDWNFGNGVQDDKLSDNIFGIWSNTYPDRRITSVDTGTTGLTATIEDFTGPASVHRFFIGDSVSGWANSENWVGYLSLYSQYKGLVEYLQNELPFADLVWFMPPAYYVSFPYSHDMYYYKENDEIYLSYKELRTIQKNICQLYDLKYIDGEESGGISIVNASRYFNSNDVHPNNNGYYQYADIIIKSY